MITCDGCKYFNDCTAKMDVTTRWDSMKVYMPGPFNYCALIDGEAEDERSADDRC